MIAFDTNVLIYGQQAGDDPRHHRAIELLYAASATSAIMPLQVLGEFLNVCTRKLGWTPSDAIEQTDEYADLFNCPETKLDDLIEAANLASNHDLQFFDALIVAVAANSGATMLLSEDMHDGLEIAGLRIVNPFNPENRRAIESLLASSG